MLYMMDLIGRDGPAAPDVSTQTLLLSERFLRAILLFEVSPTELWAHCSCMIH